MRSFALAALLSGAGLLGLDAEASAAPRGRGDLSVGISSRGFHVSYGRSYSRNRCDSYSRTRHVHRWSVYRDRVWVEPFYDTVVVGYDGCGRAIYDTVVVRAGYWKHVQRRRCGCGARY